MAQMTVEISLSIKPWFRVLLFALAIVARLPGGARLVRWHLERNLEAYANRAFKPIIRDRS